MMRVIRHADIVEFAEHATIPVINGLSDLYHPCQAISDMLTIEEHKGKLKGLKVCYVGDGNNVCNSLIVMCHLVGIELIVSCPKGYEPFVGPQEYPYQLITDPQKAVSGCDVIYTDVWTSMGQEDELRARRRAFEGYAVTQELISKGKDDVIFMHCLPAHRGEEVDEFVVDADYSVVFDQSENRLHAQKAVLALLMGQGV
jgi:ornithine carbamoyltransferase